MTYLLTLCRYESLNHRHMKKTFIIAALAGAFAFGCTNTNPDVKMDPKADAESYCKIGEKDTKAASLFWDKVEETYGNNEMQAQLEEFEAIIVGASQAAAQEHPVRLAKRGTQTGEVSYYPDQDAQTYLDLAKANPEAAAKFLNEVQELYNADGLYEDLAAFMQMCGLQAE